MLFILSVIGLALVITFIFFAGLRQLAIRTYKDIIR